jgi:hypothetical protein
MLPPKSTDNPIFHHVSRNAESSTPVRSVAGQGSAPRLFVFLFVSKMLRHLNLVTDTQSITYNTFIAFVHLVGAAGITIEQAQKDAFMNFFGSRKST